MDQTFYSCCDDGTRIDFTKMEVPNLFWYIYWDRNFSWTLFWMIFYPIYWIVVSQFEYRTKFFRRWLGGPYIACGLFALTLIPMSIYRDCRFLGTVRRQPQWSLLRQNGVLWSGHCLVIIGLILVIFSFRALGLWSSLLGDFFGIHEKKEDIRHRFPYTWCQHPMYIGSVFIFLGYSLGAVSQAGIFLSFVALVMYCLAIHLEHAVFCRHHHITVEVGVQTQGADEGNESKAKGHQSQAHKHTDKDATGDIADAAGSDALSADGEAAADGEEGKRQTEGDKGEKEEVPEGKEPKKER